MISVQSVSKTYGKKQNIFEALKDINFEIPKGKTVAIVGKSGSGKSTLMHVMSGLDSVTSGKVVIDGVDITKLKKKQRDHFRARKIGFIFQSFFVQANESVYNNVVLPLEISRVKRVLRRKRVMSVLKSVELDDKAKSKARNLSGGQKQRLAIARAIMAKPSIIFADEPTGNLDSQTGDKIEEMLFGLNKEKGTTLIIVTHDHDLAKKCDIRIHIKDGEISKIEGVTK